MYEVYELTDPSKDGVAFYVGVTKNLKERIRQHNCTRYHGCPSFDRIVEIREKGMMFGVEVVFRSADKMTARIHERDLILSTDGLVNSKEPYAYTSIHNQRHKRV